MVQSHLIQHGFVKDYMVWNYHGEANPSVGASEANLLRPRWCMKEDNKQHHQMRIVSIQDLLEDVGDDNGWGNGNMLMCGAQSCRDL